VTGLLVGGVSGPLETNPEVPGAVPETLGDVVRLRLAAAATVAAPKVEGRVAEVVGLGVGVRGLRAAVGELVTVHTNTQALYFSLDNTAIILQIDPARLHFKGGTVGGGFGGKVDVITEPIATLAAMKTGRPVRYVYSREEEMRVSSTRSANRIRIVDGVMNDGRIVSREVTTWHDAGAYSRHSPYGATKHAANVCGPYTIPNVSIDVHCVYTNRQPASAFRGFGVTEASFATEMQMDRIARTIGADPWELRLRNAYKNGDERPYRKTVEDATLIETIQAAASLVGHELSPELQELRS